MASKIELYKGDCLEVMDRLIAEGVKVDAIITDYNNGMSMRKIAEKNKTNHKLISQLLKEKCVEIREPKNLRGKKKFDCDKERIYNNMATHLRFDIDLTWLMKYEDFEKLKVLNESITNRGGRFEVDTAWYKEYIEKFYYEPQFNLIYERWKLDKKQSYKKPSIDHIIPKAKGGSNDIENLQFLSWFENRCKNDMTQTEWENLKINIKEFLI